MDGNVKMNLDSITGEPLKLAVTEPVATELVVTEPVPQVAPQLVYTESAPQLEATKKVKYPGKENVGLIFGIISLINGICSLVGVFPVYGWIIGVICAVNGIACAIVALIQWGIIKKNTTSYSNKILTGVGLAIGGLFFSVLIIAALILLLFVIILCVVQGVKGLFQN